jgi:hypothetical protein
VIAVGAVRVPYYVVRGGGVRRAAYWFTASTSFANPAVTTAELSSDTFARSVQPTSARLPLAQALGYRGALLFSWSVPVDRTVTLRMD